MNAALPRFAGSCMSFVLLCSCSSSSGGGSADAKDLAPLDAGDAGSETVLVPDGDGDTGSDVLDVGSVDPSDTAVPPDCAAAPGSFGCPCSQNADCDSARCVFHLGQKVCTVECVEDCPEGWICEETAGSGSDKTFACASRFPGLCLPCSASSQCPSPMDRCVVYGLGAGAEAGELSDAGAFCGGACSEEVPCPGGYDCTDVRTVEGPVVKRCVHSSGTCACTDYAVEAALSAPCSTSNAVGTCTGWRACTAAGLSQCDAPAAVQEVCGNQEDEDCDGVVEDADVCVVCSCDGKECGDDGCGGDCGQCPANHVCQATFACLCVPDCTDKDCGDDGCGGDCGQCAPATKCTFNQCQPGCASDAGCPALAECVDGFCQPDLPDDAVLLAPTEVTSIPSAATQIVKARVVEEGLTEAPGAAAGLTAEIGWGPGGSDPLTAGGWIWASASYEADAADGETWTGKLTGTEPGTYAFTFRLSLTGEQWTYADKTGSKDGFSSGAIGTWTVTPPPAISGLSPDFGTALGGDTVTVNGSNFTAGLTLLVDGAETATVSVSPTAVTFKTSPHAAGSVAVQVKNPDGQAASKADAFAFVLKFTPDVDGDLSEWQELFRLGTNTVTSDWDASLNRLETLYAAYDETHVYFAVAGFCEAQNYIVGYVDADFGLASGTAEMIWLSDNTGNGDLDDALSNILTVTVPGFGGDYGFGSRGMASYKEGGGLGDSLFVGWRQLGPPYNLAWTQGSVVCSSKALEAAVPLSTLYAGGVPKTGSTVAVVVKLTDKYGDKTGLSNQALPEFYDPAAAETLGAVATLLIR